MLQTNRSVLWLWAALLALFASGLLELHPIDIPVCGEDQKPENGDCPVYHFIPGILIHFGDFLNRFAPGLTVLATMVIGAFTIALVRATGKLHAANERQIQHFQRTEAAFVFIQNVAIVPMANGTRFVLTWANSGNTPTANAKTHMSWKTFDGDIPPDYDFPDLQTQDARPRSSKILIGPKGTINLQQDIPNANLRATASGPHRTFIWAWVEYNDVFSGSVRHRTEYCVEVLVSESETATEVYDRHNGAEDECLKRPSS